MRSREPPNATGREPFVASSPLKYTAESGGCGKTPEGLHNLPTNYNE